jgi:hypothetical protein
MVVVPEATGCTKSEEESVLMEVHHHLSQNARTKKKKAKVYANLLFPPRQGKRNKYKP